mgnify:FL=1
MSIRKSENVNDQLEATHHHFYALKNELIKNRGFKYNKLAIFYLFFSRCCQNQDESYLHVHFIIIIIG